MVVHLLRLELLLLGERGGTIVYNGTAGNFSHTGLTANTQYFYKVFLMTFPIITLHQVLLPAPLPAPLVFIISGGGSYCLGGTEVKINSIGIGRDWRKLSA